MTANDGEGRRGPPKQVTCCGCMRTIQVARVACCDCSGRTATANAHNLLTGFLFASLVLAFLAFMIYGGVL